MRGGFYERHAHREIESPDKEPLIDVRIAQKKR